MYLFKNIIIRYSWLVKSNIAFFVLIFIPIFFITPVHSQALEKYVHQKDNCFQWKCIEQKKMRDATVSHLEMISQTWQGLSWNHHLQVLRPNVVRHPEIAFLFVTGDGDGNRDLELLYLIAQRAGAVAAVITKIPNQPLFDNLKEDALIAYTFDQYLKTEDETWPLLFPMVKSVVYGMDAIQAFVRKEYHQKVDIFAVSGASKRGWTAWLTGAVDSRVVAIAPMVIDMLNMKVQTEWAKKMYGRQSEQISDYTNLNLVERMDSPLMVKLREWVDPYSYRQRYTMPKLLLLGTNDPYWVVDSLRHYWNDLPEPKLVYQTPNAGHNLGDGKDALQTLAVWFQMIADGQKLPKIEWQIKDGANGPVRITMRANQPVKKFQLWTALSDDRDFRTDIWSNRELEIEKNHLQASVDIATPQTGFKAFFAEAELISPAGDTYKLSTQVQVVPDNINKR
ncbi:MAG: PhoPQ-activated pathogenicity-related family protein [Candidatus Jettenia sp.]|nr:PhoPQ-activated pathogenicity-related family protein [Candidatus Jettenia sp.]